MDLNPDTCYRALATRDARFDGLFFVGVVTTRIYCRPVCVARTPGRARCRFFPSAAAAEKAGFRPCLRCRPELAPGQSSVDSVRRVARSAAARIEAGALNNGYRLEDLADEFGMSTRQLRRVLRQELGVSPVELAQTHRLLLAKQLLTETRLPITRVAFASGFESLRRFNALFRSHYRLTPSQLRRSPLKTTTTIEEPLRLQLNYRLPFAWEAMLRFLEARAIEGVEAAIGKSYGRTAVLGAHRGWLTVEPGRKPNALSVEFSASLAPVLAPLLSRLRHLFDLNARPDVIATHLGADKYLGTTVAQCPGLRVPGAFDGFELGWRAILGQRVSVRAATTLAARVAAAFGQAIETPFDRLCLLTPEPGALASASLDAIASLGITRARAASIQALARSIADGGLRLEPGVDPERVIVQLKALPGIGEWTAQYIAMRALGWPDALPDSDLGLLRALNEASPARVQARAEAWRPWRSYAVMHLWNGTNHPTARSTG